MVFLVDDYGGAAQYNATAMAGAVAHSGGGYAADEYGAGAGDDTVRWPGAGAGVAQYGSGHAADQYGRLPRPRHGPTDVG